MWQNQAFIGCLAKIGQDQHLKLSSQGHILFYKVLFDKEHKLFRSPFPSPSHSFFSDPPFQNFGMKVVINLEI